MESSFFISLVIFSLFMTVSPGPGFFVVTKNTLSYGKKAGYFTVFGLLLGDLVHIMYSAFGIGYIISKSIILFNVLKIGGSMYLLYIAYKMFKAKTSSIQIKNDGNKKDNNNFLFFKNGFFITLLNPKATLFFVSLFSVFIPQDMTILDLSISVLILQSIALFWFILVVKFFTLKKVRDKFSSFELILNKIFGSILSFFGIKILFDTWK